jgi:hypothetical protein
VRNYSKPLPRAQLELHLLVKRVEAELRIVLFKLKFLLHPLAVLAGKVGDAFRLRTLQFYKVILGHSLVEYLIY